MSMWLIYLRAAFQRVRILKQNIEDLSKYKTNHFIEDYEYEKELFEINGTQNLCIAKRYIDMGKGPKNPVRNCLFYEKVFYEVRVICTF